ncbi:MAG: hypothetical protein EBR30_16910 [Cytophagia bacterium]|jgi:hypothetical protein|nr:hypothetical protein [Cytophagia bacterium]NBW36664.1 hypothetical protein [Cytophagia bacterium]
MLVKFILDRLPLKHQVEYLRNKAVYLGTRSNQNRQPHLYMLGKQIAEILFEEDDESKKPESLVWLPGLQQLENHIEREFKSSTFK